MSPRSDVVIHAIFLGLHEISTFAHGFQVVEGHPI